MNDKIERLFEEARRESLSESEQASLRNHLRLFVSEHPARPPFMLRVVDAIEGAYTHLGSFRLMQRYGVLTAVCVFALGLGTYYTIDRNGTTTMTLASRTASQLEGAGVNPSGVEDERALMTESISLPARDDRDAKQRSVQGANKNLDTNARADTSLMRGALFESTTTSTTSLTASSTSATTTIE